jgi:hypothetical protein
MFREKSPALKSSSAVGTSENIVTAPRTVKNAKAQANDQTGWSRGPQFSSRGSTFLGAPNLYSAGAILRIIGFNQALIKIEELVCS